MYYLIWPARKEHIMADANRVYIFDTTLRDAEQTPGASLTVQREAGSCPPVGAAEGRYYRGRLSGVLQRGLSRPCAALGRRVEGPVICGLARAVPKDVSSERVRPSETRIPAADPHLYRHIGYSTLGPIAQGPGRGAENGGGVGGAGQVVL